MTCGLNALQRFRNASFAGHEQTGRRVGVDSGEERPERRPHRHEQQQHIADTRPRSPVAGPCRPVATPVDAARSSPPAESPWSRLRRLNRHRNNRRGDATSVRPVGHGPVRGHSRVEKTVARPATTAAGGGTDASTGRATDATMATVARTPVGPVRAAAGRPFGPVRLQAAAVADQHGGRQARAAIGRGQAAAAAAAVFESARSRRPQRPVLEVERALCDNTRRLSRRRGRQRLLRRGSQILRAGQPHAQKLCGGRHRDPGDGPLTGPYHH